jgi:phosphatidylglycerophosphatase C
MGPAEDPNREARTSGVAAFDFDGTLVRRDSFVAFLRQVGGPRALNTAFARSWRAVAGAPSDPSWRDVVKSNLVKGVLGGRSLEEVQAAALAYSGTVAGQITPSMRQLLARHTAAGHLTVIVSASLELYLQPAAELLGMDAAIGTRLDVGPDGRLTGRLEGANCRGVEKSRRLTQWMSERGLDPEEAPLWAYGDSAGDRQMLELARYATRVRRGRLRSLPEGLSWPA